MNGRIHFLSTGHSDCIILESNGKIAMVDAAEDTDYPANKPHLKLPGYEDIVLKYLFDNFSDSNGKVHIDFVLGTHCHSDHIGGFDTVINHPDINVKRAYLKPYNPKDIFIYERISWDNLEVYTQMLDAIKANRVELIESFDREQITLGDFKITFFNGSYRKRRLKFGENINSVATLVELANTKTLLAGDLNYKDGDEKRLAPQIGKVDILKVGHHGYVGSTSSQWVKTLNPDYAIICNWEKNIYPDVKARLKKISESRIICTADCNGVIAKLSEDKIEIEKDIM